MTKQEVFDLVARHLLAQGPAYYENDGCRYRTADGKKCAVGYFIPDELYCDSFEGEVATSPKVAEILDRLGLEPHFMLELQRAHDDAAEYLNEGGDFAECFKRNMRRVANQFGLDAAVLDEI